MTWPRRARSPVRQLRPDLCSEPPEALSFFTVFTRAPATVKREREQRGE
ncbi:hypothetical protein TIFTF001_000209 [Ficus carica]|uniref:Uncharacterized protein n=1 Tax=Ficus carica TaxID=3494 RepID=A0AA87Z3U9_FICCA|nr:hypothetical protein TIFTF001_000209 [Ficus carica]